MNDKTNGTYIKEKYDSYGNLITSTSYRNGKRHGKRIQCIWDEDDGDEDDYTIITTMYKNGFRHGERVVASSSGYVRETQHYIEGKIVYELSEITCHDMYERDRSKVIRTRRMLDDSCTFFTLTDSIYINHMVSYNRYLELEPDGSYVYFELNLYTPSLMLDTTIEKNQEGLVLSSLDYEIHYDTYGFVKI